MSILIKGMEMPESGTYEVSIDSTNGKDKTVMSLFVRGEGGVICCGAYELVPVPPHGRCIDVDALVKSDRMVGKLMMYGGEYVYTQAEIDRAPTIIPAEKGE